MKIFLQNSQIKWLDILVAILTLIALSYEIIEYIPSESLVILEVETSETIPNTYSISGADSDQYYLLEYVKIYPHYDDSNKQPIIKLSKFKYDNYVDVDLKVSEKEHPQAYFVSKEFLQKEFGKETFKFEFLDDNRLTFKFQFDANEQSKPNFKCKVGIVGKSVPCKVVEKSPISSWYYTMGLSMFIIIIIMVIWLPIRLYLIKPKSGFDNQKKPPTIY